MGIFGPRKWQESRWTSEYLSHISAVHRTYPVSTHISSVDLTTWVHDFWAIIFQKISRYYINLLYQPTTSIIVLVSASTYLAGKMAIVPRNGRHNAVAHMNFTFRMFVVPLLSKEAGYAKFIPNNRGLPDIINDKPKLCVLVWFFWL
jgi:hypothetical protein